MRNVFKWGLVYEIFDGNGDTGSFGTVKQVSYDEFGDVCVIINEECVGLRKFKRKMRGIKLKDGGNVGGTWTPYGYYHR